LEFVNAVTLQQTSLPANITASAEQILGDIYRLQLQFPTAINHYQKAFELWQQQNDFTKIIECLNTLGNIYEITGNLPLSINTTAALDIASKMPKPKHGCNSK
jgi:tetratricopeptide (TPR) repeat protein